MRRDDFWGNKQMHNELSILRKQVVALAICSLSVTCIIICSAYLLHDLCAENEARAACFRAWATPLLGVSTSIVAISALQISRRQYSLADGAQKLGRIEGRLRSASGLYSQMTALHAAYHDVKRHLVQIEFIRQHNGSDDDIREYCSHVSEANITLKAARASLRQFTLDQVVDNDLVRIAEDAEEETFFGREHATRIIFDTVRMFGESRLDNQGIFKDMSAKMLRSGYENYYDRFQIETSAVMRHLQRSLASIEKIARNLKDRRQKIVKL